MESNPEAWSFKEARKEIEELLGIKELPADFLHHERWRALRDRAAGGDRDALEEVFRSKLTTVYREARHAPEADGATFEDHFQSGAEGLWKYLTAAAEREDATIKPIGSIRESIHENIRNSKLLRKQYAGPREEPIISFDRRLPPPDETADLDTEALYREVGSAFRMLREEQQVILGLRYGLDPEIEPMKLNEIREVLKTQFDRPVSPQRVRQLIELALRDLEKKMSPQAWSIVMEQAGKGGDYFYASKTPGGVAEAQAMGLLWERSTLHQTKPSGKLIYRPETGKLEPNTSDDASIPERSFSSRIKDWFKRP